MAATTPGTFQLFPQTKRTTCIRPEPSSLTAFSAKRHNGRVKSRTSSL